MRKFFRKLAAMAGLFSLTALVSCASGAISAGGPTVEQFKQAMTARLMQLKPSDVTERNVLFQDVHALNGGNYQVTAVVRDYSPGYPRNRYYGQTCVGHFDKQTFTMAPDGSGGWNVEGAMTPSLHTQQCKANPSAGASSIPLASLGGSPATTVGATGNAPTKARGGTGSVAKGSYECWANGEARMLMNFSILNGSQYKDSNGKTGSYSLDGNSRISFHGGSLDGAMPAGYYGVYYAPQGRPTVSYRSQRSGAEVTFCQWVR